MYKTLEFPKNYIVWDLETSGLDGTTCHILEIGMFKVIDEKVVEKKRWVLNHNIEISQEITNINGMTKEILLAEGVDPGIAFNEFLSFIRESEANLTHNGIKFDINFLVKGIKKCLLWNEDKSKELEDFLYKTSIDTAVMFKANALGYPRKWNESFYDYAKRVMSSISKTKYNLGVCCDELGVDRSKIKQHRALGDVELTHEVFKEMLIK